MAGIGGYKRRGGEERFYSPPALRKYNQQHQKVQSRMRPKSSEKRIESDDGASSTSTASFASPGMEELTNLDRFLEHTTPKVSAQFFPKTSMKGWRNQGAEIRPYFVLGDLWESFREWSAYGAGVPLVLNKSDSVVQYYVPYLSAIQLYIDPSKPSLGRRKLGEESDADSSRETSSDESSDCGAERDIKGVQGTWSQQNSVGATTQGFSRLSLKGGMFMESSIDEGEISNPPGLLIFEYMEQSQPYGREPLADKVSFLASKFPELRTCRSCDLTPASWISVAWYPIYRIPIGPTLQNVDACFLTFHSLSTSSGSKSTEWAHNHGPHGSTSSAGLHDSGMSLKLPLPIFGLASYKYKLSDWDASGIYEGQKFNSLLQAADNWLRLLHANHPDYRFFVSHNSYMR